MFAMKVDRLVKIATPLGPLLEFSRLEGSDGLSRNGEYRITVLSRRGDIQADELLGPPLSVAVTTPHGSTREFNGLAVGFYQVGQHNRQHQYLIVVRPWTWLLTRTSDCKIFQDKSIRQIIEAVFADHPYADFEFHLTASYTTWDYCVQYRESDFNFLARLMEQEGMHFFFRHQNGKHTLIIADSLKAHVAADHYDEVPFREPEASHARVDEGIREWSHGAEIQPTRFIQRDFNFEKPRADMQADAGPARPLKHQHQAAFDIFDYPGEYEERGEGQRVAAVRIEEMRHQFDHFNGEGNAAGLATGGVFKLLEHPRIDQNQEYLITLADYRVEESPLESELVTTELISLRFRAIPSAQIFHPPRLTPKPIVQGPQTAIVVGPAGDEIYTDKYGRVKVQFHWDRYGKKDQNSSCWIRVSHPWAGQNWGMIAIPRIGQEVIVEFLEGDPDRPIITGRVYNADQMPPYALPDNMTQTGIKTRSTKGGGVGNFNEIRFEDKKGAEQLYIHAEKNQDNVVENDETTDVGHDRTETVGHNETITIHNDRTETVDGNETLTVKKDRTRAVEGNETVAVTKNRDVSIQGNETVAIQGTRDHTITGAASSTPPTPITFSVGGSTVAIKPSSITLSYGASSITINDAGVAVAGPKISLNG